MGMKRTTRGPLRRLFREVEGMMMFGVVMRAFQVDVHDGHLSVFVAHEPRGWHMSISHRTNEMRPRPGRYPTWDEIADARYQLVPDEVTMAMLLPPRDRYVNLHDTTFHLHQVPGDGHA